MRSSKFLWIFTFINLQLVNYISCDDGISLAFAIDNTHSMWNEIDQLKKDAKAIMQVVLNTKSSEVKNFILVTINDPDVTLRADTTSPTTFLKSLNSIKLRTNIRNRDCQERVLAGIEKALQHSRSDSYIYVFTDASTKELWKQTSITRLCQRKRAQVVFVLTGDCGMPSDRRFTVYYEIAKACSGHLFRVRKNEINSFKVLNAIKLLLKGKHSILKWRMIRKSSMYTPVLFTVDEDAEYVIVSSSGTHVELRVTKNNVWGHVPESEYIMWNENGKVIKLIHPKPGTYFARVKADSDLYLVIYGRTEFAYDYGFSILEPKSIRDTSKQLIAGLKHRLLINVTDSSHSVNIKSAQILDTENNDRVTNDLPLRNIGENVYITEAFVSPNFTLKIAINGVIKKTNESITRYSSNINPQIRDLIPESIPVIKIDEANKVVAYGSGVTLICKVTAHPAPRIEWHNSSGALLPSNRSVLEDSLFVSYLKVKNIKQNETFTCKASNSKGIGKYKEIQVNVKPVFTKVSNTEGAVYSVEYGEDLEIPCNIKSDLPIKINWLRSGTELSSLSTIHAISPDGSKLTLKSVDKRIQGKYSCRAILISDPTVQKTRNIEVNIPGLARPVVQSSISNITITKGDKIELRCIVIQGYPKPHVQWFMKNATSHRLLSDKNSEVLTVNKAMYMHAGQYKCEATNPVGIDTATFVVTVSSIPDITIDRKKSEVPYDSDVELTCRTSSFPPPSIVWKDEKGTVLQEKVTYISEYEFASHLQLKNIRRSAVYTCLVSNNVGSINDYIKIKVPSPFEVKSHIDGVIEINYGSEKTLQCDIKSVKPMTMRWYKWTVGVESILKSSEIYTISDDGTKLIIKSMDTQTAGNYTCEASLVSVPTEKIAFYATVNVTGLFSPKVINSTILLNENKLTAICRIQGVPRPIISWQFKPNGAEDFRPIPGSGEELIISEITSEHSGIYKCVAHNDLGSIHRELNVTVEERPVITNSKYVYYGVVGDLAMKIPCNLTGFPVPTVVWKKGGETLNSDSKYTIKGTTLYINKPILSDTEEYTCEAENKLGIATENVHVEVVDNFDGDEHFNGDTHDVYAERGTRKTITCNLKITTGEDSIRWYKDGMSTKYTGSTYTIDNASIRDEANYTCRVNTDEGSTSETYVLYIGYLPLFEDNSPSPILIDWQNRNQTLDCSTVSKPPAEYKWLHDGNVIDIVNNSQQISINDWGTYTCHVSNVHGNISKTFIISGCYITMTSSSHNHPLMSDIPANTTTWPSAVGNSDVFLKQNEEVKLSCPNNTKSVNAFKAIPNKQEVIVKCDAQDKFTVEGMTYRYSDLECTNKVEPEMLATQEQCSGPDSVMIRVGFKVNGFMDAYKVCYDGNFNVPLFAKVLTSVSRIGDGIDSSMFEWSRDYQGAGDWKPEGSCECCYTQGQLADYKELAFGPAQSAAFNENLNSVPIWNPSCDKSRTSWQTFVSKMRTISLHNKISTWTGASEYVIKDDLLVPRYLWKVFTYDDGSSVMVYINNNSLSDGDIKCSNPCDLMIKNDIFFYCCTLDDFSNNFGVPLKTIMTN